MKLTVLALILFSQFSWATVRVAFFRAYDSQGRLAQLEPNGKFFHLALQLEDGRWIHSHPHKGVEIVRDISEIGTPYSILENQDWAGITETRVQPYIGRKFDSQYIWEDESSTYCAKLVGQLLHIQPKPMRFMGHFWVSHQVRRGALGLSPDDIYNVLRAANFVDVTKKIVCDDGLLRPLAQTYMQLK